MSKQQRPPQRAVEPSRVEGAQPAREPTSELGEHAALGNQALAAQITPEGPASAEDLDSVRADAMALVERAAVALYTEPRPADRVDRFVAVLETSKLPADRKAVLVDKLVADQEAAVAIERAAERWFGGAGAEARAAGMVALDGVWAALTADGGLALSDAVRAGPEGGRAEQLVGELATAAGDSAMGEAVRGFCREVYLIVAWQEDEEEDEALAAPAPEVD